MPKGRFLLGACAALLMSGQAMAAAIPQMGQGAHPSEPEPDVQLTERIADVNAAAHSITLADGHRFKIPHWISFDHLQKGELVSIVYTPNPHRNTSDVKTVTVI